MIANETLEHFGTKVKSKLFGIQLLLRDRACPWREDAMVPVHKKGKEGANAATLLSASPWVLANS